MTDGAGVKAVFDSLEKDTFNDWVAALEPGRSLMVFGKASGNPPLIDPFALAPRSLKLTWPVLPMFVAAYQRLALTAKEFSKLAKTA